MVIHLEYCKKDHFVTVLGRVRDIAFLQMSENRQGENLYITIVYSCYGVRSLQTDVIIGLECAKIKFLWLCACEACIMQMSHVEPRVSCKVRESV